MATNDFSGAASTALATYDSNWNQSVVVSATIADLQLDGAGYLINANNWSTVGAYYNDGVTDGNSKSEFVLPTTFTQTGAEEYAVTCRMNGSRKGYYAFLGAFTGTTASRLYCSKHDGTTDAATETGNAYSTVSHDVSAGATTLSIQVTGANEVTVTLNGTPYVFTDSGTELTGGYPGLSCETLGNTTTMPIDSWTDGAAAAAPVISSPTAAQVSGSATSLSGTFSTDSVSDGTLYWYVSASITPPSATDLKAGTSSISFGSQAVGGSATQTISSMTGLSSGTAYYVHYIQAGAAGDSNIITSAQTTTYSCLGVVSAITGGASLSALDYCVFNGQDISSFTIAGQGTGETTDASGNLSINLDGLGFAVDDLIIILIGDWTTAPTGISNAAVCYTTVTAG